MIHKRDPIFAAQKHRWIGSVCFELPEAVRGSGLFGSFLSLEEEFGDFFSISKAESKQMDPQQKLLLEGTWHAFEDAGIIPSEWAGEQVGVWIGLMNVDHRNICEEIDVFWSSGNTASAAAGRISYEFGLLGPAVPVDTACSSFLVALNASTESLVSGKSEGGVVGAVNLCLSIQPFIAEKAMTMLSSDGRCRTFDAKASGFVRGEGSYLKSALLSLPFFLYRLWCDIDWKGKSKIVFQIRNIRFECGA